MQRDRFKAAQTWLSNVAADLEGARGNADWEPSRACFQAQQSAKMALKATLIALADDHPRTYIGELVTQELQALGESIPSDVMVAAKRLDRVYTASRYADARGGAGPLPTLQKHDAETAFSDAKRVCDFAEALIRQLEVNASPPA